jgi:DNA polymerase
MSLFAKRSTATTLEGLKAEWATCQQCPFYTQRKHVVMGEGKIGATIFAVGQAPGKEEDASGLPFVGSAGAAAKEQFERAGIPLSEIFWTNVLACRPFEWMQGVREAFAKNCADRLETELLLVRPKMIVAMGVPASLRFLPEGARKTKGEIRGRRFLYRGLPGITTIHPSAATRKQPPGRRRQDYGEQVRHDLGLVYQLFEEIRHGRPPSPSSPSSLPS